MRPNDRNGNRSGRVLVEWRPGWIMLTAALGVLIAARPSAADDEALILTPPGFAQPGQAKTASGTGTALVRITVRDRATGRPTPCRLNVVGPDGNFYQPESNGLSPYSL